MSKKKSKKIDEVVEKKPSDGGTSEDLNDSNNPLSTINSITENLKNQGISPEQAKLKGRHFAFVVYPESAPADWIERLKRTGLAFVVSPLHDKDENADGTPKKPHYHVIISWGNTTTYKSACGLCDTLNCPFPQLLKNPNGMYRYLTHKDNPEKYQYMEQPETYNGWVRPLDSADVANLKNEIWQMVYTEDCQEYGELLMVCAAKGSEYFEIASNNTLFFKAVCDGFRNSPVRTLMRYYSSLDEGEVKESIKVLLEQYGKVTEDKRKD